MDVLQDEREHRTHVFDRELADVDAIHQNSPLADVVEPHQQVDHRRLA